jgi:hypothetical protein
MASQSAVSLLREQLGKAHHWMDATAQDVSPELAHQHPPGKVNPIAAQLVHVTVTEDFFVQSVLNDGAPLFASSHAGKTGFDSPPPQGEWGDWAKQVKVDLECLRQYSQAVYAATDDYLAGLADADLDRTVDLSHMGFGEQTASSILTFLVISAATHAGEISALKGINGLRGYPF